MILTKIRHLDPMDRSASLADPEGGLGSGPPLENHKWLYVSFAIMALSPVPTPSRSNKTPEIQKLLEEGPYDPL